MSSHELIVVTHPIHAEISTQDVDNATPPDCSVRGIVRICPEQFSFREAPGRDFTMLARRQQAQWEAEVQPLLARYPSAKVAYFGLAPVPLAFHLGSLVERLHQVLPFQRHHTTLQWSFADCGDSRVPSSVPAPAKSRATQPAVVSVNVTTNANKDALLELLGGTSCELDVGVEQLGEDRLQMAGIEQVAEEFRKSLEWIEGSRPGVMETHIVSAVPCGVAFAMGTKITATRHTTAVLYQYRASENPPLSEALRVPLPARVEVSLSDEDRTKAKSTRHEWESTRRHLVSFLSNVPGQAWFNLPGLLPTPFSRPPWNRLSDALSTPLDRPVDQEAGDEVAEFEFTDGKWRLGTTLLKCIVDAVSDHARAGRMLLLHESIHLGNQGLTADVAPQVRHLPKVVEDLDYQADVWAIMHEFSYSGAATMTWDDARNLLRSIIRTAASTMWAFDALNPKGEMEVRRVNRYLIWYTNICRLLTAESLDHALMILSDKPCVELSGPGVVPRDGRLVMQLNRRLVRPPEMGFIDETGRIRRVGGTSAASPAQLARALGDHDGVQVEELVRKILAH